MAFKQVQTNSSFEEVTFESKGDMVEGYLVEIYHGKRKSDGSDFTSYTLQTDDGNVKVYGCAQLNRILPSIELGTLVRLTYNGKVKRPGAKAAGHDFTVEADNENVIPVAQAPRAQTAAEIIASAKATA